MKTMLKIRSLTMLLAALFAPGAIAAQEFPSKSLFHLTGQWTNQEGSKTALSSLAGGPSLVVMVYTRCHGACPLIVQDLQKIEQALSPAEKSRLKVALVSFDTEQDSPEHLKAFATGQKLDLKRWVMLQGNDDGVRELAAALGVQFKKRSDGEFDHSNVITVLGPQGEVAHQIKGLRQNPAEAAEAIRKVLK